MKKVEGWLTFPAGFLAAGVKAGIKASGKEDVALIYSTVPATSGAVFTQNKFCSAPVLISKETAKHSCARAIVVNSGCANACTGEQGFAAAERMRDLTAAELAVEPTEVYVCSTGVIGQFLPMDKVEQGIIKAQEELSTEGGEKAALAIQTTDTFVKKAAYEFVVGGKTARIAGIAKGSGMIHPNMATLLTFITTDAAISPDVLKRTVKAVADHSFNMVVVDGDTSTNDTMIVLANGLAENEIILSEEHPDFADFYAALLAVAQDLAKLIARDGEGATKFLEVKVGGAASFADAKLAAMAIAKSPLVKTAFFGEDPNWGRIVCAAGYSGAEFAPGAVSLKLGGVTVVEHGMNVEASEALLTPVMAEHDIVLDLDLGCGDAEATVWTCDFSYEYVKINGEYHT